MNQDTTHNGYASKTIQEAHALFGPLDFDDPILAQALARSKANASYEALRGLSRAALRTALLLFLELIAPLPNHIRNPRVVETYFSDSRSLAIRLRQPQRTTIDHLHLFEDIGLIEVIEQGHGGLSGDARATIYRWAADPPDEWYEFAHSLALSYMRNPRSSRRAHVHDETAHNTSPGLKEEEHHERVSETVPPREHSFPLIEGRWAEHRYGILGWAIANVWFEQGCPVFGSRQITRWLNGLEWMCRWSRPVSHSTVMRHLRKFAEQGDATQGEDRRWKLNVERHIDPRDWDRIYEDSQWGSPEEQEATYRQLDGLRPAIDGFQEALARKYDGEIRSWRELTAEKHFELKREQFESRLVPGPIRPEGMPRFRSFGRPPQKRKVEREEIKPW